MEYCWSYFTYFNLLELISKSPYTQPLTQPLPRQMKSLKNSKSQGRQ